MLKSPPAAVGGLSHYIGRDGVERTAPDIPTLAAHIRGGDIVPSTLVRSAADQPWRLAETDPDLAALFVLAGSRAIVTDASVGSSKSRRAIIIARKVIFLVLMFFVAVVSSTIVGLLNSNTLSELFDSQFYIKGSFPTFLMRLACSPRVGGNDLQLGVA
jgi:hypothetical protein